MSKRFIVLLVGVMAGALLVAGCGSSNNDESSESTETTASLSKAQFVKQGNAICKAGNKEIEAGFESFAEEEGLSEKNKPTDAQAKKASETILIPAVKKQVEGLRALGTPEGDEGEVDEILGSAEGAIEEAEEDPVALIEEEGGDPFAKANRLAREYGLTACGEEG